MYSSNNEVKLSNKAGDFCVFGSHENEEIFVARRTLIFVFLIKIKQSEYVLRKVSFYINRITPEYRFLVLKVFYSKIPIIQINPQYNRFRWHCS